MELWLPPTLLLWCPFAFCLQFPVCILYEGDGTCPPRPPESITGLHALRGLQVGLRFIVLSEVQASLVDSSGWSSSCLARPLRSVSLLRVDGYCCISVHVPTFFCCCEMQPVVLGDEKCQSVFFMTLPRECFVLYCWTVEHRSRKSGDLLQTGEFTSGDKVTHFCFCSDSFQCSCMRTIAHLFLRVSSISAHGSGRDFLTLCLKYIPSWHGLCLSRMGIASAAILLLC